MTENFWDNASANASGSNVVKLTGRDLDDARRLLALFARNEPNPTQLRDASDQEPYPSPASLRVRAHQLLENRRHRKEIFGNDMFGEPAWDMLLLLYAMQTGQRQSINRLSDLAGASRTTALRWIDYLEQQQLIRREAHPTDLRTVFLALTDKARDALDLYLSRTVRPAE